MRISDWSSDVCSSDLTAKNRKPSGKTIRRVTDQPSAADTAKTSSATSASWVTALTATKSPKSQAKAAQAANRTTPGAGRGVCAGMRDRKSVGLGKRVAVRVDAGGRRIIKKKQQ